MLFRSKAGGYALVIDTSAQTPAMTPTPVVLYTNGQNDLTEEILSQLNAAAPGGIAKPEEDKPKPGEKKEGRK